MRYRILPYRQGSRSAKALAEELGGKVLKLVGSTYAAREDDVVINWGNTTCDYPMFTMTNLSAHGIRPVLNGPVDRIKNASNKLLFFQQQVEEGNAHLIPEFWTNKEDIPDDAYPAVCRQVLAGSGGLGIVMADSEDDVVDAPLYTKYLKKKDEYRVHLGLREGETITIAVQRKARRLDCDNPDWQIRNHANGFIFQRSNVNPPAVVIEAATATFISTGLDFGAVDVIWNNHEGKAWVLEINTAPGLEGQTIKDYADFFRQLS